MALTDRALKDSFASALANLGGSPGDGGLREALGWDEVI